MKPQGHTVYVVRTRATTEKGDVINHVYGPWTRGKARYQRAKMLREAQGYTPGTWSLECSVHPLLMPDTWNTA